MEGQETGRPVLSDNGTNPVWWQVLSNTEFYDNSTNPVWWQVLSNTEFYFIFTKAL